MYIGLVFWIVMIIWFVLWLAGTALLGPVGPHVNAAILFVLFALLGWKVFGPVIKSG